MNSTHAKMKGEVSIKKYFNAINVKLLRHFGVNRLTIFNLTLTKYNFKNRTTKNKFESRW